MNKNIQQVLVRVECHNQIWYETISIEAANAQTITTKYNSKDYQIHLGWPHREGHRVPS